MTNSVTLTFTTVGEGGVRVTSNLPASRFEAISANPTIGSPAEACAMVALRAARNADALVAARIVAINDMVEAARMAHGGLQ